MIGRGAFDNIYYNNMRKQIKQYPTPTHTHTAILNKTWRIKQRKNIASTSIMNNIIDIEKTKKLSVIEKWNANT